MINVSFERMAQIVAISAFGKDSRMSQYNLQTNKVMFTFSEYVKSQIHLNVVSGLYGRSLGDYVKTLQFIRGAAEHREVARQVLNFFYTDIANFLINNTADILATVVVDCDFDDPKIKYDLNEEVDNVSTSFKLVQSKEVTIQDWEYSDIFDIIINVEDFQKKMNSYTLARLLLHAIDTNTIVESEVSNES